ncbi:FAD binding domain-containing protein [Maritimibacter fusiformis]|uniref:Molybdopterin dehydrogenase n=1 Tax=Maritimibacter fusiformis TaxID=2603819 RepID=A0A5D0RKF8_9RHOB|nr:FAD binding domain-containing protein [Maritimibacter fusiformis]TYB81311.1 molybdopterin dehydrogenase [Maritimibacter fusiformis]
MLSCRSYQMPKSLAEALALWRGAPEGSRLIAGATDILPWAREGRAGDVEIDTLIDLSRVAELSGYQQKDGRIRLGANVVWQDFLTDPVLARSLPCMPFCSVWFADDQIRQQATLAGNLVNASPAADGTPPVIALNGDIEIARLDGDTVVTRTMPVADFISGPGRTDLKPGEIVVAVTVDALPGYGGSYQKVGQRRSLVISSVCCAAVVKTDPSGKVFEDVRLALGGVGPKPMRLTETEAMLRGKAISADLIERASAGPVDLVASRTRVDYRRTVVRGFVRAAVEDALAHAAQSAQSEEKETANA